jgi:hypothetical protein
LADTAAAIPQFIRYLSMYIDLEWKAIQQQNKGRGVVLAATWVSLELQGELDSRRAMC